MEVIAFINAFVGLVFFLGAILTEDMPRKRTRLLYAIYFQLMSTAQFVTMK